MKCVQSCKTRNKYWWQMRPPNQGSKCLLCWHGMHKTKGGWKIGDFWEDSPSLCCEGMTMTNGTKKKTTRRRDKGT